jgi:hypothetical protein
MDAWRLSEGDDGGSFRFLWEFMGSGVEGWEEAGG